MEILLHLIFLASLGQGADKMPTCVRPKDFSMGKFVASYEGCLNRQAKYCSIHKESKECTGLPERLPHPYWKVTVDDIDPTKRCKILPDGSYRCLQDPVRFVTPQEAKPGTPQVASTPSVVSVPLEDSPGIDSTPAPTAMPSVGQGPLPHPPRK